MDKPTININEIDERIKKATANNSKFMCKEDMVDVMKVINEHNIIIKNLRKEVQEQKHRPPTETLKRKMEEKNEKLLKDIDTIKNSINSKKLSKRHNKSSKNNPKKNKYKKDNKNCSSSSESSSQSESETDSDSCKYNL